ncbi:cytosolic phospholipase A2, partial [Phenoliferia sp. Uapishka_3]
MYPSTRAISASSILSSRRRRLAASRWTLTAFAALGTGSGLAVQQRCFGASVLRCEEGASSKDPPAKVSPHELELTRRRIRPTDFASDDAQKSSFIDLPDFSSLREKVNTDFSTTLSSLTSTLSDFRTSIASFQDEISLGPSSTYSRVVASRNNADLHPEIQWDATVRLGTELGIAESAFIRTRKRAMVGAFARLMEVEEREVDPRDIPIVSVAGSGGGYRAMVNTLGNIKGAKEMGIWDCHVKERIVTPFLDPSTLETLTNKETKDVIFFLSLLPRDVGLTISALQHLLSGVFIKESSKGGQISLSVSPSAPTFAFIHSPHLHSLIRVDVYGTLVTSRLFIPSSLTSHPISPSHLKVSSQRQYLNDGSNPLPIYCTIRHEIPHLAQLEEQSKQSKSGKTEKLRKEGAEEKGRLMRESSWMWFELTPMEFGCEELGAWIPTWSLGRLFENGKNVERQPELSLTILNGIFASAFCATLYSYVVRSFTFADHHKADSILRISYYKEVKPLISALPYFNTGEKWLLENYESSLDAIHPITPAEIPSFVKNLKGLRPGAPESITKLDTLGLMDAGANLNVPYVPLFRRSTDLVLSFDASADSHDLWFSRAEEYAVAREMRTWPRVQTGTLFDQTPVGDEEEDVGRSEKAARKVDEAKAQEGVAGGEREEVRMNPNPPPVGSAPSSVQSQQDSEGGGEKMPSSQPGEPPLGRCNIWIGSTKEDGSSCRNDRPTVEEVMERDGIALAYFPLMGDKELKDPGEVWSTWGFDYPEEDTENLVRLASSNFKSGEAELKTLIRGIWMRKRRDRLQSEKAGDGGSKDV